MISVYYTYISEANHQRLMEKHLPDFTADFREKILRYRKWEDAQRSLLGRILLFKGLEDKGEVNHYDKKISYTSYGKPYLENSSLQFNLSHSGKLVVCALDVEHELGVDIEFITDINIDDFKTQMTENEWNTIMRSENKKEAFFIYWTQKEAVIKAHGQGLSIPLKSFEIIDGFTDIDQERFYVQEIQIDEEHKCFISSKTPIEILKENIICV